MVEAVVLGIPSVPQAGVDEAARHRDVVRALRDLVDAEEEQRGLQGVADPELVSGPDGGKRRFSVRFILCDPHDTIGRTTASAIKRLSR